jgi:hypothetical protein
MRPVRPQRRDLLLLSFLLWLSAQPVWADGHGPAFGFSTATLGSGDASIETTVMWRSGVVMIAPMVSYGLKENLQISLSAPFHLNHSQDPLGRFTAAMPGDPSAEVLLGWRFYHASTGIGTRNEATLYVGGSVLTQEPPRADGPSLRRQPGVYAALAAGHVTRKFDVWAGMGYQLYGHWSSGIDDHDSNTLLASLVLGWRPGFLNGDYPRPDLRFFWETTGEDVGLASRDATPPGEVIITGHGVILPPAPPTAGNSNGIVVLPNSGGTGIFSGPTFLCTYRSVAFQGGVLFPFLDRPNGAQQREKFRAVIGVSYYFLGRHK